MKFKRLEAWNVEIPFVEPYSVAYVTADRTINTYVRLETHNGLVGYGCANADPEVTGETPASVLESLRGCQLPDSSSQWARLESALLSQPTALAALDMALWDLRAKEAGLPLWKFLGGKRPSILTCVTIGIRPEVETLEAARAWVARGFSALKLKGGWDVEGDIARVRKVRESVGSGVQLSFDANQGYDAAKTETFLFAVKDMGLRFVEQPTKKGDLELLASLGRSSGVPLMADEALVGEQSASQLAQAGSPPLWNLKLMKTGGITGARRLDVLAQGSGIGVLVGCMDESALAIAAGLAFALSARSVFQADLDSHLSLMDDPVLGQIAIQDGELLGPERPGLGIEPRS